MKREALDHTKTKRLCRRLNIPLYQAVGILEVLWHITAKQAPRGDIGKLSNEDIAIGLDYRGDENALVEALVLSGWLDADENHRLLIHDWHEHAEDSVHMRMARGKLIFASGIPPKTNRLSKAERAECDSFYQSVRTASAQTHNPCAQKGDLSAPPQPPPRLNHNQNQPPPPTADFPAAAAAVREQFPETGDAFVGRLTLAIQHKVAGLNGKVKGEATDALIAKAIRHCARAAPNQNSAGLYLRTVPQCVASWLTNGEPAEVSSNPIFNPEDYGLPKN